MTTAVSNKRLNESRQAVEQPSFLITFLAWLLNAVLDIIQWATFHGERLLSEYRVVEWLEQLLMYSTRQPFTAIILGVTTVVCGVPIFLFACFAVISAFITFSGFLFIEGTLLTIGFGLLVCFLLIFGCLTIGIFTAGAATFIGIQRLRSILDSLLNLYQNQSSVSDAKAD